MNYSKIYQFKIRLKDVNPMIWRRFMIQSDKTLKYWLKFYYPSLQCCIIYIYLYLSLSTPPISSISRQLNEYLPFIYIDSIIISTGYSCPLKYLISFLSIVIISSSSNLHYFIKSSLLFQLMRQNPKKPSKIYFYYSKFNEKFP